MIFQITFTQLFIKLPENSQQVLKSITQDSSMFAMQ